MNKARHLGMSMHENWYYSLQSIRHGRLKRFSVDIPIFLYQSWEERNKSERKMTKSTKTDIHASHFVISNPLTICWTIFGFNLIDLFIDFTWSNYHLDSEFYYSNPTVHGIKTETNYSSLAIATISVNEKQ